MADLKGSQTHQNAPAMTNVSYQPTDGLCS